MKERCQSNSSTQVPNHNNKRNKSIGITFYIRTFETFSAYRKTHVQQAKLTDNYDKLQVFWTTILFTDNKVATKNVDKLIPEVLS